MSSFVAQLSSSRMFVVVLLLIGSINLAVVMADGIEPDIGQGVNANQVDALTPVEPQAPANSNSNTLNDSDLTVRTFPNNQSSLGAEPAGELSSNLTVDITSSNANASIDVLQYNSTQLDEGNDTAVRIDVVSSSNNSSDALLVYNGDSGNMTLLNVASIEATTRAPASHEEEKGTLTRIKDGVVNFLTSSFNTISHWALAIVGTVKSVVESDTSEPISRASTLSPKPNAEVIINNNLGDINETDIIYANSTNLVVESNVNNGTQSGNATTVVEVSASVGANSTELIAETNAGNDLAVVAPNADSANVSINSASGSTNVSVENLP